MANQYPYLHRAISSRLAKLFQQFSSVVILGARQVGKSTLLEHVFPQAPRIVFDPVQDVQQARTDPDLFLRNNPPPIILDEIQYAPELIPALKRFIDEYKKPPGLYLLTGSQQWGVLNKIAESLAGRTVVVYLEPLSLAEIADEASTKPWLERWLNDPELFLQQSTVRLTSSRTLYEQIWRGFLPEAHFIDLEFIPDFYAAYQRTYIERDVRLMANVSDLQTFGRFVKLVAALTAQEINYSHLGRDIGITAQTARRWLDILIQTFEWYEIPAYSNNSVKKISSKSKGYFSDTGQICYSQMISSPQAIAHHPGWGSLFESAVVNELRKQCLLISVPPQLYHWRVYSGAECDLVLERDGKFFPIEIKAKSHPTRTDARGLEAFRKYHPELNVQKGLIIAPAEVIYPVTEHDYVIPWDIR